MAGRTGVRRGARVGPPRTVAEVLLQRRGAVYLPGAVGDVDATAVPHPLTSAGVTLLEADLLARGYLASATLVERLLALDPDRLGVTGELVLADLDAALGADRSHVPLFRGFPGSVPPDTADLWVDRVLVLLAQCPEQPCVLCGRNGSVTPVSPCAHLVCRNCFDGSDYSACPICRRRIDPDDPFLRPAPPTDHRWHGDTHPVLPERARVLTWGADADADARTEVAVLLGRTTSLTPQDADDLRSLLAVHDRGDLTWLPEEIPARSTKAVVLAWLLDDDTAPAGSLPVVTARLTTATDALRLLVVRSGGDPELVDVPRFATIPRPLRRAVLTALDRLDPRTLAEDLRRHRRLWIHAAERLHPFEHSATFPHAVAAFAAVRGTRLGVDGAERLRAAADGCGLTVAEDGRLRVPTFGGAVEAALADSDLATAVDLLRRRPGDMLRRLDHLLRLPGGDEVLDALPAAAGRVAPAVLVTTLGTLRMRGRPQRLRVFFPRGGTARAHVVADRRPPLPEGVVRRVVELLVAELLERAVRLGPVRTAVVDAALDGIVAPFTQRTASRALVTLPRGSVIPLPEGRRLRLFLHWMQAKRRVDLDLSVALFDAGWRHVGTCDYTSMRVSGEAAVHSGDLISAPPPLGASEFIDLDREMLLAEGVRHVVAAVFSYDNVAFEDIPTAFAGVMLRGDAAGPVFDPGAVEQRFDLTGRTRATVPLVVDLEQGTVRWLDIAQGVTGTHHAVQRHLGALASVGQAVGGHFASGARVSLGEVARWHAAARATTVVTRAEDGGSRRCDRRAGEDSATFLTRISRSDAGRSIDRAPPADLGFAWRGDLAVTDGAEVFALHPGALGTGRVRVLAAADVAGSLRPL